MNVHSYPHIVPPTWYKGLEHGGIARVWSRAGRELSGARTIVIIGYSMPQADQFFRALMGLSLTAELERILIIDPEPVAEENLKSWAGVPVALRVDRNKSAFEARTVTEIDRYLRENDPSVFG
jgi:hypothetical protein